MRRRLWNILVALSLALCIATVGLWICAHRYSRCRAVVYWADDGSEIKTHISVVGLAQNGIYFGFSDEDFQYYFPQSAGQPLRQFLGRFAAPGARQVVWTQSVMDVTPNMQAANWLAGVSHGGHSTSSWLDLWQYRTLMILFSFLPACRFIGRYRRRRSAKYRWRAGLCRGCRYDLRGNTSGVCPECGRPIALVDSALWNELSP